MNHFAVAAACQASPGEWLPVGDYNSGQTAYGMVWGIRNARFGARSAQQRSAYDPAGSFEARAVQGEFGVRVEARYVGVSNDAAWADALASVVGGAA
ncbi:hypothetical protein ACF07S_09960 [Streptomyces sp. NPDC016640]|uniref:hypothetical protein n=1 Tax=Streptomyces sp. NPDC016640 TaxID=3364969 RepID=UPI0037027FE2